MKFSMCPGTGMKNICGNVQKKLSRCRFHQWTIHNVNDMYVCHSTPGAFE